MRLLPAAVGSARPMPAAQPLGKFHRKGLSRWLAHGPNLTIRKLMRWSKTLMRPDGDADMRIASIAPVHGFTVITANLRDFQRVPNPPVQNWI